MNKMIAVGLVLGLGGVAAAGDAKAPAKDAKAPPVVDKKPDMPMPKPPAEIADMVKAMGGSWKCTGKAYMPDGTSMDMTGTMKTKADMNGFWVHDSWLSKMGKAEFNFEAFTTYDPKEKKFRRVMVDSLGGQMVGTSDGLKDNKMDFTLDAWSPMFGAIMFKDHGDMSDPKAGFKGMGERSLDKGKSWQKDYEVVCKK